MLPKCLVGGIVILEILQNCLAARDAFRNFGTGWGNMYELDAVGWLWFSVPVLSSIITITTQFFYAWRIYVLSKYPYLPIIVMLLSLAQGGAGIYSGAIAHIIGYFSGLQAKTFRTTAVWLGGTALCDVVIATSMIYYLNRSKTGFRATSVLLTKFIRVTVETGAVCAAFAILDLAFYLRFEENNYHLAPALVLSKFYSNSLLVLLNARVRFVGGRSTGTVAEDGTLSFHTSSSMHTGSNVKHRIGNFGRETDRTIAISVNQETLKSEGSVDIPMTKMTKLEV
jgi:hypothetical protein